MRVFYKEAILFSPHLHHSYKTWDSTNWGEREGTFRGISLEDTQHIFLIDNGHVFLTETTMATTVLKTEVLKTTGFVGVPSQVLMMSSKQQSCQLSQLEAVKYLAQKNTPWVNLYFAMCLKLLSTYCRRQKTNIYTLLHQPFVSTSSARIY